MLKIRELRLRAVTSRGCYEGNLSFASGLNVIRAPNTSGKSTCLQAIIYALGLEKMWGPRVDVPLAHAMQERIQTVKQGRYEHVIQSYVEIDIENASGQILTVRRDVLGGDDKRLICASYNSPSIHRNSATTRRDFFVQMPGAAQREDGFHTFLARFMGWELPMVSRFNGSEVPLYLETIFPMLFVEQKRGWSAIQGPFPTHFQIQDVARRVMEFLLALDVGRIRRELVEISHAIRAVRDRWSDRVGDVRVKMLKGCRIALPTRPTAEFAHRGTITIDVLNGTEWIPLETAERSLANRLLDLQQTTSMPKDPKNAEEEELRRLFDELDDVNVRAEQERHELQALRQEHEAVKIRLEAIRIDLQRHQDAIRLQNLGSTLGEVVSDGHCPTCHQSVSFELLPVRPTATMALSENEEFLKSQLKLYDASFNASERALGDRTAMVDALQEVSANLRSRIRTLRQSLTDPSKEFSRAQMAETIAAQTRLDELRTTRERADELLDELKALAKEYIELEARQKELDNQRATAEDQSKQAELLKGLQQRLKLFSFSSFDVHEIALADDNFRPIMESRDHGEVIQKEINLNLSASDGVRLKWAYYLALMAVARTHKTNHPGIIIFDEPGQHQMEQESLQNFLVSMAHELGKEQQVIVATSQTKAFVQRVASETEAKILNFDGLILQPVVG